MSYLFCSFSVTTQSLWFILPDFVNVLVKIYVELLKVRSVS